MRDAIFAIHFEEIIRAIGSVVDADKFVIKKVPSQTLTAGGRRATVDTWKRAIQT